MNNLKSQKIISQTSQSNNENPKIAPNANNASSKKILTSDPRSEPPTHNTVNKQGETAEEVPLGNYPIYPTTNPATGQLKELIKKGEYLAKMGDCIACHSDSKSNTPAYAGGLQINTPFGVFYSPNITPDKETGIGNWSEQDFIRALKQGRSPDGSNYFPVFPYIYFAKITDDDARALYAYFMNIPAVHQKNKPLPFPFNVPGARSSLWGWNLLFFYPENQNIAYEKKQSPQWNRGKYIVDSLGHCSMCHTPLNIFGAPKSRFYLTGSFLDGYWAPNITKLGLSTANRYEIKDVFAKNKLINQAGIVGGPMADVNYDSLKYLTDEDKLAIATYLKTVISEDPLDITPSNSKPTLKRGKQIFVHTCSMCHQNGEMAAPIIGNSASWFYRLQHQGLTALYQHTINGFNSMPPRGACVNCSDNDIISAVNYVLNQSLTKSQWRDLKTGRSSNFISNGKLIYEENCSICHNQGKNGAPKIGDKTTWEPLIKQNIDILIYNTLNNSSHPQNAGCKACTNGEIIEAVKYMISKSKTTGNYSLW